MSKKDKFLLYTVLYFLIGLVVGLVLSINSVQAAENTQSIVITGITIDSKDVEDKGLVHFVMACGDKAKEVLSNSGSGNLFYDEKHGNLLFLLETCPNSSANDQIDYGILDFKIVTGKSAKKLIESWGNDTNFVIANDKEQTIVLVIPPKEIEI